MVKQVNIRIAEKMENMIVVFDKMIGDTKQLQNAMRTQEDLIRGDNVMNQTMELLQEINRTVEKMKRNAEAVAESVKEGAEDMRRVQRNRANNIGRI